MASVVDFFSTASISLAIISPSLYHNLGISIIKSPDPRILEASQSSSAFSTDFHIAHYALRLFV